jgi:hypothetical protein
MQALVTVISFSALGADLRIRFTMSLLHLVHQSVAIKFGDCAKSQFDPDASYAFRLTGVDGMGFLQVQDLVEGTYDTSGEPYWINKDLIRELRQVDLATATGKITYTGVAPKPVAEEKPEAKIDSAPREVAPKLPKAKVPAKKSVLKQKPIFN